MLDANAVGINRIRTWHDMTGQRRSYKPDLCFHWRVDWGWEHAAGL